MSLQINVASLVRFKQPIQKYNPVDTKHALEQAIRDAFVLEFGWKEGNWTGSQASLLRGPPSSRRKSVLATNYRRLLCF